ALPSAELDGALLDRALESAGCRVVIAEVTLADRLGSRRRCIRYGDEAWRQMVAESASLPRTPLRCESNADFAYVFSSGTTGVSKACRVSHWRSRLSATAFSRLVHGLRADDVLYCPLPLYHASPLLLGFGACLVAGATLALRSRFSASAVLADVRRFDATVMLYVGELGRAWLAQPPSPHDRAHRLRALVGNGMNARVWAALRERFAIPHVREFYAASEFPGAVVNITDQVGSVGHLPFGRLRGYRLVRVDANDGSIVRDASGRAIECAADEPGELVLRLRPSRERPTGEYLGYVGEGPNAERIARDLFEPGDLYCRSGDLLRRDRAGHFYFVDRLGDTFRFKSENVSTREVEDAFSALPGVVSAVSLGVRLPEFDGKLGLLALEVGAEFSLASVAERMVTLPRAMRPCFVRLVEHIELTPSLKYKKSDIARDGVDPSVIGDPLFFRDGEELRPLDPAAFAGILGGAHRF
ncbi:MAG TPA: AMP-binding protein, partial [Polyangiaceae bacterium]|nr:AMP-binding protein [Polyangiaceae bacterium]